MPSTAPIAIRARPQNILKALAVGAAALGGLVWWRGLRVESGALAVMLAIALPIAIRRARDSRPTIVLDETGIADRRLGIGTIAWRDIRRAYARSLEGATFICLEFFEPERYLGRLPLLQRVAGQIWRYFDISPIHVSTGYLDMRHDELFELVLARCEASSGRRHDEPTRERR
ncbi:MAG TPA: STM3941 family protein [Planctomycetota bacterium]|nr:STM3941 family protein [Planctomycetota bacterium]